jgi:hypothetical protein
MTLFPNIYVVLLADSAENRKGLPLRTAYDVMSEVGNTKLIRGRSSVQAILDDLSGAGFESTNKKKGRLNGGSCCIIADELAASIVEDPSATRILTDIYDSRDVYSVNLKSGKVRIKNLCVSMLAASNETYLKEVYSQSAVYGGLLGRTFLVKPNEFRPGNSLLRVSQEQYNKKGLIEKLEAIAALKGAFIVTEEAIQVYETWYLQLRESYRTKKDKTGVIGRIHTGVLKIVMILAAGTSCSLTITGEMMSEAIAQCLSLLPNYDSYTLMTGSSELSAIGQAFLSELEASPGYTMSERSFLVKHLGDVTPEQFKQLIDMLGKAGMISTAFNLGVAGSTTYTLTAEAIKILRASPNVGKKAKPTSGKA